MLQILQSTSHTNVMPSQRGTVVQGDTTASRSRDGPAVADCLNWRWQSQTYLKVLPLLPTYQVSLGPQVIRYDLGYVWYLTIAYCISEGRNNDSLEP